MRRAVPLGLILWMSSACPGGGTKSEGIVSKPPPAVDAGVSSAIDAAITPSRTTASLFPIEGVKCQPQPCVYHAGTRTHYLCLSGADGRCFHFGGVCDPKDKCVFDQTSTSYRLCQNFDAGRCIHYGAPCSPPNNCAFNPTDGLHHVCVNPSGGRCASFGKLCNPR